MTTFEMTREWIDELDAARHILHSHLPLSSAFSDELPLREAAVVFASIGDMIRGCVVPTSTVEGTESSDFQNLTIDSLDDYSREGSGGITPKPVPTETEGQSDNDNPDGGEGEDNVGEPDDQNPYQNSSQGGSGTSYNSVADYNPYTGSRQ